jgi:hypothetical protein
MDIRETGWGGIDVRQDKDQWRALVNMVTNFLVPLSVTVRCIWIMLSPYENRIRKVPGFNIYPEIEVVPFAMS